MFLILSIIFYFLTGLCFQLGPSGFWHLALPVGVCSLECNNNDNNNHDRRAAHVLNDEKLISKLSAGGVIAIEAKYHTQCLVNLCNSVSKAESTYSKTSHTL